jgi:hypothetical protein
MNRSEEKYQAVEGSYEKIGTKLRSDGELVLLNFEYGGRYPDVKKRNKQGEKDLYAKYKETSAPLPWTLRPQIYYFRPRVWQLFFGMAADGHLKTSHPAGTSLAAIFPQRPGLRQCAASHPE